MDTASSARIRAIVDRLLASTLIAPRDRADLEEIKAVLAPASGSPSITIRHEPRTMPEPSFVTLRMPEGGR
jgi:hypothetical protein